MLLQKFSPLREIGSRRLPLTLLGLDLAIPIFYPKGGSRFQIVPGEAERSVVSLGRRRERSLP
jgi:hypothetical protein